MLTGVDVEKEEVIEAGLNHMVRLKGSNILRSFLKSSNFGDVDWQKECKSSNFRTASQPDVTLKSSPEKPRQRHDTIHALGNVFEWYAEMLATHRRYLDESSYENFDSFILIKEAI